MSQRKTKVVLSKKQKALVRTEWLEAEGRNGIINELAGKYNVTRKTISSIINKQTRELRKVTEDVETKIIEKKQQEILIDTYKDRVHYINLIKTLDIAPVLRKMQKQTEELELYGEVQTKITNEESDRVKIAIQNIENLHRGIDQMSRVDIHFHVEKMVVAIRNMDREEMKVFAPELKKMICDRCPLYKKHQQEQFASSRSQNIIDIKEE